MRILPPTTEGPPARNQEDYDELMEAGEKLQENEWLPVQLDSNKEADAFAARIRHNAILMSKFTVSQRGDKVFLKKKSQNGGSPD